MHWTGYVGVLDCQNLTEIYVTKRTGGKIRTQLEQDIYELNKSDPDRVISGLTPDNEVRNSRYPRNKPVKPTRQTYIFDNEDPDRVLY